MDRTTLTFTFAAPFWSRGTLRTDVERVLRDFGVPYSVAEDRGLLSSAFEVRAVGYRYTLLGLAGALGACTGA